MNNIIIIMTDGARADFFLDEKLTPNTHRFLEKYGGVKYTNCYSTSSWTLPVQMSLFTGLLPVNHGLNDITYCNRRDIVKVVDKNYFRAKNLKQGDFLVHVLNELGYTTKSFSNHLTYHFLAHNHHTLFQKSIFWDFFYHQHKKIREEPIEKPFFWYIYDDDGGHAPYGRFKRRWRRDWDAHKASGKFLNDGMARANPAKWTERKLKKLVANQVHQYDTEKLSKFWKWFEEKELYKDTMVLLLSDHGEEYWEHEWVGHVANCYEGIVKIPLIMYNPDYYPKLDVDTKLHSIVDIPATVLNQAEFGDGLNLAVSNSKRVVFFEFLRKARPWTPRHTLTPKKVKIRGLRYGKWKLLYTKNMNGAYSYELYNVDKDPREEDNLIRNNNCLSLSRRLKQILRSKYDDI
jgi:arylsulfatase A-like enzyme